MGPASSLRRSDSPRQGQGQFQMTGGTGRAPFMQSRTPGRCITMSSHASLCTHHCLCLVTVLRRFSLLSWALVSPRLRAALRHTRNDGHRHTWFPLGLSGRTWGVRSTVLVARFLVLQRHRVYIKCLLQFVRPAVRIDNWRPFLHVIFFLVLFFHCLEMPVQY